MSNQGNAMALLLRRRGIIGKKTYKLIDEVGLRAIGWRDVDLDWLESVAWWTEDEKANYVLTEEDIELSLNDKTSRKWQRWYDTSEETSFLSKFRYSSALAYPHFDTSNGTAFGRMFSDNYNVVAIPCFDMSKATSNSYQFTGQCANLTYVGGLYGATISISLVNSPITRQSYLNVIDSVADLTGSTSRSLTLSTTTKSYLTEEDYALATAKNWTII